MNMVCPCGARLENVQTKTEEQITTWELTHLPHCPDGARA